MQNQRVNWFLSPMRVLCTGGTLRLNSITSMLSSREDDYTEPPVESFKMMLIMLRPDAVEGFHHQVQTCAPCTSLL